MYNGSRVIKDEKRSLSRILLTCLSDLLALASLRAFRLINVTTDKFSPQTNTSLCSTFSSSLSSTFVTLVFGSSVFERQFVCFKKYLSNPKDPNCSSIFQDLSTLGLSKHYILHYHDKFTIYDFFATVIRFIWKAHWQQFFEQTPVLEEIGFN
ncbi:hypothetical protein RO3G_08523 [Rhizopus delemar RA 99-880]|uniref:Uncharacterized protein n=1 Tax=Rhizopus delemar (strain RA 99-880 / ATCC MYA-4621 / FGSC 9543 / NRRL 43880) TaxID=246409 RepID=I1C5T8_RHIO9|nr:hypothetical protein RO3G_08523 [Rhizopus delemar RA 99-880]|eukprot:EIE83818.1 hypothetical protein RO3G_08523 [Rhizopus delemar RA 99-880]